MNISVKVLFKNASYLFTSNISIAFLAFLQGIIITRTLGPANYGAWGLVLAFTNLTSTFLSFRTGEPLTRYIVEFKKQNNFLFLELLLVTALLTDFLTRLLAYLVIIVSSPLIAKAVIGRTELITILLIYGSTILFNFTDATWYSVARDQKKFKLLSIIPLALATIQLLGIFILSILDLLNLLTLALLYLAISIIKISINITFLKKSIFSNYGIKLSNITWKDLLTTQKHLFGFWKFMKITYLSSIVSSLIKEGDILILGYYRSDLEVGWYRLAKNLAVIIQQIGSALSQVIYQNFNELIAVQKIAEIKKGIFSLLKIWAPAVLIGLIIGLLINKQVIILLYGEEFINASIPFTILISGVGISLLFFWAQPMVLALDLLVQNLKIVTLICVLSIISSMLFTDKYGFLAVAISLSGAWILSSLSFAVLCLLKIRKL